jgi:hypothetical protein
MSLKEFVLDMQGAATSNAHIMVDGVELSDLLSVEKIIIDIGDDNFPRVNLVCVAQSVKAYLKHAQVHITAGSDAKPQDT